MEGEVVEGGVEGGAVVEGEVEDKWISGLDFMFLIEVRLCC